MTKVTNLKLADQLVDRAVTDVRMTGSISGLELTRRLRNNQRTSAVGIIVLTTVSRPQDADVALKAGLMSFSRSRCLVLC